MECSLPNDDETLRGHSVTVTQQTWDSSTKSMNRKKGPFEKMRKVTLHTTRL